MKNIETPKQHSERTKTKINTNTMKEIFQKINTNTNTTGRQQKFFKKLTPKYKPFSLSPLPHLFSFFQNSSLFLTHPRSLYASKIIPPSPAPCKRVMMSSTSEPGREMTPVAALAGLGFLVRALKEADDVSLEGGLASPLLVMWAVAIIRFRGDPVLPCSSNSSVSPKIE